MGILYGDSTTLNVTLSIGVKIILVALVSRKLILRE